MKYAGGCFGCLGLICFGLSVVLAVGSAFIVQGLTEVSPEAATMFASLLTPLQAASSGCCCLSSVLAIALLAMGARDPSAGE